MYVESNLPTSELTSDEEGSGNKIKRKKRLTLYTKKTIKVMSY